MTNNISTVIGNSTNTIDFLSMGNMPLGEVVGWTLLGLIVVMFFVFVWLKGLDWIDRQRRISKKKLTKENMPIKFPDNLGINKNKKGYYVIKNNKKYYLSNKELSKLYAKYITPLKHDGSNYPTRVVQL